MTVKFKPDHPKEKDGKLKVRPVSIQVEVYDKGPIADLATGEKILPKYWDFKKQEAKSIMTGHVELNLHLQEIKNGITQIWRDNKGASREVLKDFVRKVVKGETDSSSQKKTVIEAVQLFIAQYAREKEAGTVKRYKALLSKLTEYAQHRILTFENLDFNFYDAFKVYLYGIHNPVYSGFSLIYNSGLECYDAVPRTDGNPVGEPIGLMDEVVFKYFVNLKTICAWAEKRGHEVNPAYKSWETIKREYAPITLTKEELEALENYQFDSKEKHLEIARDYLSLECRTGQRISDLRRFRRDDLQDGVWTFFQKKGNRIKAKLIELPLDGFAAPALVILQKYKYELPKISEQKLNENIKKACKLAGIDALMHIERWAGNRKIRITGPKYEFISTHTGKKSFITILAGEGVPVSILSILTGTSQRTIERHYLGRIQVSKVRDHLKRVEDNTVVMKKAN
jgi:integrase